MNQKAPARPTPVTIAGWLVVGGSIGVVVGAFTQMAGLQSLDTREAVERYLSEPPGNALDLGVHDVLDIIRVLATVAAACAAATAVLGYQVLQRSRGARVAVTVLVVPMFLTGLVTGGIAPALVAAAVVMLWFQPARGWFDDRDRGGGAAMSDTNPYDSPPSEPAGAQPGPYPQPYGQPYGQSFGPPPGAQPYAGPTGGTDRAPRPGTVTAAAVITIVTSVLVLLAGIVCVILGALGSETFYDGVRDGGRGAYDAFDNEDLQALVLGIGVVLAVWSVAAIVLAVLVLRRSSVARVLLVISAALSLALSLIAILSLVSALTFIAAVVVIVLLFTGGANDWFARRSTAPPWS